MNLLENILQVSNTYSDNFALHAFAKDRAGKYIDINETVAQTAGLKINDLLGLTDHELCWAKDISQALANDRQIMEMGTSKHEFLYFHDHAKNLLTASGIKSPLRTRSNKIIGVMGFSVIQKISFEKFGLTKREYYCFYHSIRGKSAQEVGNILFISKRTVEKHIENIKYKLGCSIKSELVDKAVELGLINFIPESLLNNFK